jgi:hypothetical protein
VDGDALMVALPFVITEEDLELVAKQMQQSIQNILA